MVLRLKVFLFQQLLKWFSNLSVHQNHLQGLENTGCWASVSRISISVVQGKAPVFAVLESSQVLQMLEGLCSSAEKH